RARPAARCQRVGGQPAARPSRAATVHHQPRQSVEEMGRERHQSSARVLARGVPRASRRSRTAEPHEAYPRQRAASVRTQRHMTSLRPLNRVYLVVWWFDELGGMERHVTEMAHALTRAGVEVIVFSELRVPRSNAYGRSLRSAGIKVVAPGRILAFA